MFDENCNSKISYREFVRAMKKMDANSDGGVDIIELHAWMKLK